jgi:nicotinamidase-related amidase
MPSGYLRLSLRSRVELFKGSDVWEEVRVVRSVPTSETAVILCDLWDNHWCSAAVRRVDEMVPRVEVTISAARANGVQIIHAPSETMAFYAESPHRKRILAIPRVSPPEPLDLPDPPLPIDSSDCCDSPGDAFASVWTRQHPGITITGDDVVSDNGLEVYSLLAQKGIRNLIIAGVHTNFCVLKRSFAIKQMTKWGIRCVLVRDLTDVLYNPARPPCVSHDEGTELVVQYVEQHWCPSILSADLLEAYQGAAG